MSGHRPAAGPAPDVAAVTALTPSRAVAVPLALGLAGTAVSAAFLVGLGRVVDTLAAGDALAPMAVAVLGALAVAAAALQTAGGLVVAAESGRSSSAIRGRTLRHLLGLSPLQLEGDDTATIVGATVDQTERAVAYRVGFFGPIVAAVAAPVVVLAVVALAVSPWIAGILAIAIPLIPAIIVGFQRVFRGVSAGYRRSAGQLSAAFFESVQGLAELALAAAAGRRGRRLAELGERNRRQVMSLLAGNQVVILVVEAAFGLLLLAAAAALAATALAAGDITAGQAVAVVLLSGLLTGPVSVVGRFFYVGLTGRQAERAIAEQLGRTREPAAPARPADATAAEPDVAAPAAASDPASDPGAAVAVAVAIEGVTAGYPGGPDVLAGLDLVVARGERVAITGPSGAGKSTILELLQGRIAPRAGRVLVLGRDVAATPADRLAAPFAVVAQHATLFSGSVADNLRLAAPGADEATLWDALASANLADDVRRMPRGLDTPVGERGLALSGGQAQRVAIARAFLRDAPILLLDEPTSQVDLAGEALIAAALADLAARRTTLLVTHRPGIIGEGTRVVRVGGAS